MQVGDKAEAEEREGLGSETMVWYSYNGQFLDLMSESKFGA